MNSAKKDKGKAPARKPVTKTVRERSTIHTDGTGQTPLEDYSGSDGEAGDIPTEGEESENDAEQAEEQGKASSSAVGGSSRQQGTTAASTSKGITKATVKDGGKAGEKKSKSIHTMLNSLCLTSKIESISATGKTGHYDVDVVHVGAGEDYMEERAKKKFKREEYGEVDYTKDAIKRVYVLKRALLRNASEYCSFKNCNLWLFLTTGARKQSTVLMSPGYQRRECDGLRESIVDHLIEGKMISEHITAREDNEKKKRETLRLESVMKQHERETIEYEERLEKERAEKAAMRRREESMRLRVQELEKQLAERSHFTASSRIQEGLAAVESLESDIALSEVGRPLAANADGGKAGTSRGDEISGDEAMTTPTRRSGERRPGTRGAEAMRTPTPLDVNDNGENDDGEEDMQIDETPPPEEHASDASIPGEPINVDLSDGEELVSGANLSPVVSPPRRRLLRER